MRTQLEYQPQALAADAGLKRSSLRFDVDIYFDELYHCHKKDNIKQAPCPAPWTDRGSSTRQEDTEECRQQPLLDIQFECELDDVRDGKGSEIDNGPHWPVSATLTNGVVVDCDFVISATGAKPNTNALGDQFEVKPLTVAFAYRRP